MSTYQVRVGGCPVGTVTTFGTITEAVKESMDYYLVRFDTGEVRRMRYNQALTVKDA